MELGTFSISLAVKGLQASKAFYEKCGFTVFSGDASQNWLIMENGEHAVGLFQGMFEKNTLTFNPGWDSSSGTLDSFTDVRELQRQLKAEGVQLVAEADEATTGPASFIAVDPDGNPSSLTSTFENVPLARVSASVSLLSGTVLLQTTWGAEDAQRRGDLAACCPSRWLT